ncbi:MAG: nucleotidyl transferase AbiEii/AbiGii toxin family protein [Gammaproteobacteria bacterium]|nr:MAG: nucleotidyl transferase AbiEii/AbiGii toxin family protein [Gammaproteobacteria bacterium]
MSHGKFAKAGNIAASIRQRLLNRARNDKRPFNELLQYYAMERFLYRLSQSGHANCFILKGALLLSVWLSPQASTQFRPTMDIDMLGRTSNEEDSIIAQIKDIISIETELDGLNFDPNSIRADRITEDADYKGIRVRFTGGLDNARVHMQIDIGFGDIVYPGPVESELPTLLDSPALKLLCYSRESAIAEKFEAMLKLGELNSRMKDFFDIWLLSRQFDFVGNDLAEAIRLTLEHRGTELPEEIVAFTRVFIDAKQVQWSAFHKRLVQDYAPADFGEVVAVVETFLGPIASVLVNGKKAPHHWSASGPWV